MGTCRCTRASRPKHQFSHLQERPFVVAACGAVYYAVVVPISFQAEVILPPNFHSGSVRFFRSHKGLRGFSHDLGKLPV